MVPDTRLTLTESELKRRQLAGLWLDGHRRIQNESDAIRFMHHVGFALRYNATPSLRLAAMFMATGDKRCAIELTNALLARSEVVETNVIARRLVLVDADVVPAVYALRRRGRSAELSSDASRAWQLIRKEGHATSGEVRRYLGVAGVKRPDRADLALEELQREMLVDRGPSSVPSRGIPYLSPEGFPYHIFEDAHPDLFRAGTRMSVPDAVCAVIETYLRAAVFAAPPKLASMFRLLFTEAEIRAAIEALLDSKKLLQSDKYILRLSC